MSKYMQTASEATKTVDALFALIPEEKHEQAATLITQVFNYGIRISPRGVQSTVRLNAVQKATENLPVSVRLKEVTNENTGYSFKALDITYRSKS